MVPIICFFELEYPKVNILLILKRIQSHLLETSALESNRGVMYGMKRCGGCVYEFQKMRRSFWYCRIKHHGPSENLSSSIFDRK